MSLLSLALSLVFLALSFLAPNTLTAFLGLGALGVAAFARLEPRVRTLNLALLTLAFTLFLRNSGNTLGLIGLVGILVALTTLPRIPRGIRVVLGLAILLLSVPIAGFANTFIFELGIQIGIFAAMSLGLNVVVGMAGLLDLGYAAFFAVGAYTWAIFGSPQAGKFLQGNFPLPGEYMYLFMLIAVVTTAITGLLIGLPALRLRGDYLAIVTLGLGEVVRMRRITALAIGFVGAMIMLRPGGTAFGIGQAMALFSNSTPTASKRKPSTPRFSQKRRLSRWKSTTFGLRRLKSGMPGSNTA